MVVATKLNLPVGVVMNQYVLSGLKSGLRGKSFHSVVLLAICLMAAAWLGAAFSPRHPQTVAMDIGFSAIRFSLTFMGLVWVHELVSKEIDRRTVFFVLAYPVPRLQYILGRFLAIATLTLLCLMVMGGVLFGLVLVSKWGSQYAHTLNLGWPVIATLLFYWLDAMCVVAVALLLSTVATSTLLPLAVGLAFAAAARMLGPVLDYLMRGADGDEKLVQQFGGIVEAIRWILPDLDRIDLRLWPLYGIAPEWPVVGAATVAIIAYIGISVCLACLYFRRREFT